MSSSPARTAANRANATRSNGPRTVTGKANSSRNALQHGAHAADSTLLVAHAETHAVHLNAYTAHYSPLGPVESLLVRRLATLTLRLDLLSDALDALLALDERRALIEHLHERFGINEKHGSVRGQPSWSDVMRAYDGNTEANPFAGCITSDPIDMPDPHACVLAYTLSSARAAALFKHEAAAERRFHSTLTTLDHLQAQRRRAALRSDERSIKSSSFRSDERSIGSSSFSTRRDETPEQALAAFDARQADLRAADRMAQNEATARWVEPHGARDEAKPAQHSQVIARSEAIGVAVAMSPALPQSPAPSAVQNKPNVAPRTAACQLTQPVVRNEANSLPSLPSLPSPSATPSGMTAPGSPPATARSRSRAAQSTVRTEARLRPDHSAASTARKASSSVEALIRAATRDVDRTHQVALSYLDPL